MKIMIEIVFVINMMNLNVNVVIKSKIYYVKIMKNFTVIKNVINF